MDTFIETAATAMGGITTAAIIVGTVPRIGKKRAFQFLCSGLAFVTTGLFVISTAWLGTHPYAIHLAGVWFITGSVTFYHAIWVAQE